MIAPRAFELRNFSLGRHASFPRRRMHGGRANRENNIRIPSLVTAMQKTILYLSHGGQKYHDQTRYSVLTLLALLLEQCRNDFRIIVYTDRPDQVPAHDLVQPVHVIPKKFAGWRGPLEYVHRIKLEVLRRALDRFGAPLIYVDSDTGWLRIPDEPLAALSSSGTPSACYLHKIEGSISASFFPQYFRLLRKQRPKLVEWRIPSDPPWTMWNCGTVGIPSQSQGFVDDVLHVSDELLPHVSYRNCVEQLALSLVAGSRFEIRPFDAYLQHWWSYGSELPVLLQRFFDPLPPGLPRFCIMESDLRTIQSLPANRLARWCAKVRNSFDKRKIDLLAYRLRRCSADTPGRPGTGSSPQQ
jgi:hypothetical protein